MAVCTTPSLTLESYEEIPAGTTTSLDFQKPRSYRRRHSSFHPRQLCHDYIGDINEGLLLKVFISFHFRSFDANYSFQLDQFLEELERRLDSLENFGNLQVDTGISRAYATLQAVRARCSQVSGEMIIAGRKRARIMVETVESRYHHTLAAKATLNDKVHEGISLLENTLNEFEKKAFQMKDQGFIGAAGTLMDGGRRVVDGGIEKAKRAAGSMEVHIQSAILRAKEHGLICYEDLPIPWRVNPHITKGYRFTESKLECVHSIFGISNESVNIWSHAIGLFIVLSIAFHYYPTSVNFSQSTAADIGIAAVFFFAACKCLVCSTMWHTMNSVADQTLMERFACVDYTGISLLIAASIMTTEYTAFYCEPVSRWIYLTLTALLGIGGVILPWHPTFNRADLAWARVAFYMSLGATGLGPAIQLFMNQGSSYAWQFYAPIAKSLLVYTLGAIVYASQVPEKWYPGAFDYIGGSHNLWHFAVLLGILFHYLAMQEFFSSAFQRAVDGCGMK